jgi:NAD(P)-dependent dehydrogenase (short-subunit alcohol dehydrogenase family)
MLNPEGRVILVSGSSRGIGQAIADRLLRSGFIVSAGLRRPRAAPAHPRLTAYAYDADHDDSARQWVAATIRDFGRIDGLVNAAGILKKTPLIDSEQAELFDAMDRMWQVNVKGPVALVRAAWPHLIACGEGRVVNVSSLSGKRIRTETVAYSMSKYALMALHHDIRRIGWPHGIRATALCPGAVNTAMHDALDPSSKAQITQPEDLAELVDVALRLPNNASVAEILVNWQHEAMF